MTNPRQHLSNEQFIASMITYCTFLQTLHDSFPLGSSEREALFVSAKAIIYSMHQDGFREYLSKEDLTQQQLEHLNQLGLGSNSDTEDN